MSEPMTKDTTAGGVEAAAIELLSHLQLYVMEKLEGVDADMLHDRMYDLTRALAASPAPAPAAGVEEALRVAHEYVIDGLNAQDQRRRDVEGYPGLMKREQSRLDQVREDVRLVEAALGYPAAAPSPKAGETG